MQVALVASIFHASQERCSRGLRRFGRVSGEMCKAHGRSATVDNSPSGLDLTSCDRRPHRCLESTISHRPFPERTQRSGSQSSLKTCP
jgi:hypothetical protein